MDIPVTTFRGVRFTKPKEHTTLETVLDDIKSEKWKDRIEKCRKDLKHKDWLPVFTPTGSFSHRSIKGMDHYNGIICLDVDDVDDPVSLKDVVKTFDWVHVAYITPSGRGLKVMVRTNCTPESYKETEEMIAAKFEEATGFPRDNRCKDIARIQFVSYDPDLFYNPESSILEKVEIVYEEL